ncbi:MAG: bifunctional proline dehydrogenase/L-glutamate gamma-semialdehyde dehydrogenase [Nitrospinae bacterium]|nr:bifunctional proline dehydrogenase/L-glutamate gamma-semialdehyde dehydrogenase [Nitrospinota bacterium]
MEKNSLSEDRLETITQSIGWRIFSEIDERSTSFWEAAWWEKQIMEWCMADAGVKLQVLRFIDAFPSLKSDAEIVRLMKEYFPHPQHRLPLPLRIGEKMITPAMLTPKAAAAAIRYSIKKIALQFISGANIKEAMEVLKRFRDEGVLFTMDLLGEAVANEKEAEQYAQAYIDMLQGLRGGLDEEFGDEINVSLKLSSLYSQFDPIHPEETIKGVYGRLKRILLAADEVGGFVNIDTEQFAYRDSSWEIFKRVAGEKEFVNSNRFGIVIQSYLKDSGEFLASVLDWLKENERDITIRLVKGAYWDFEVINARQKGWPVPVFTSKCETDAQFEKLSRTLLLNSEVARTAIASHNVRSIARAAAQAREYQVPEERIEFQVLYGMGDLIKTALVNLGYDVRVYTPYGELLPGMAYLVRRILENTSNESFLRRSFGEHVPKEKLLAPPDKEIKDRPKPKAQAEEKEQFANCPLSDFSREENREAMRSALAKARGHFGGRYPAVIGSKKFDTGEVLASVNPSDFRETVGVVAKSDKAMADKAVEAAVKASRDWRVASPERRAGFLFHCARIMRERRMDLAAWMVYEVGKNWGEADADVAEAVDFLNYYATEITRMGKPRKTESIPGEDNFYGYRPRGVGLAIAPWNFPLAILTGMTAGTLAAGNAAIMKPSRFSPVIGYKLMEIFLDAGLPDGVVNYLPGQGGELGDYLVRQAGIDFIAFTGSREIGLRIRRLTSEEDQGNGGNIKSVIAEMGGKNAVIVDGSADLDDAVKAIIASAFGYGGQKCSAASRIIVLKEVYKNFLERFVEGVKSVRVGQADDPASFYGPLIDVSAVDKVKKFIEIGEKEADLVLGMDAGLLGDIGYFAGPAVFSEVDPNAVIAQEEIFGPVASVIMAGNIQEAVKIANNSRYALTAGIFSRSPANIEFARRELEAGNIYINRGITGAVVRRQPFGGFKMSGIGSKAGGPDYLKQFMFPVTVTENIVRHGFAPLEDV